MLWQPAGDGGDDDANDKDGERISSALSHLAMTIYDDDYEEMSNITDSRELHDSSKDMH